MMIGDRVSKEGGDYRFDGEIVALFRKRSGVVRCVVEDDRGVLFIFRPEQLVAQALPSEPKSPPKWKPVTRCGICNDPQCDNPSGKH